VLLALLLVCAKTLSVDLAARTIAGQPITQFERRTVVEIQEGSPTDVIRITVGGHDAKISVYAEGTVPAGTLGSLEWTDPAFQVKGVGVGSTVRAFDNRFGRGTYSEEERPMYGYRLPNDMFLAVEPKCLSAPARTCTVTAVRLIWGTHSQ